MPETWLQTSPTEQSSRFTQPVAGSQESPVQATPSSQVGGVPAVQAPAPSQVSAPLQASPSAQAVPTGAGTCPQPPTGSQESMVQALASEQSRAVPAWHSPP